MALIEEPRFRSYHSQRHRRVRKEALSPADSGSTNVLTDRAAGVPPERPHEVPPVDIRLNDQLIEVQIQRHPVGSNRFLDRNYWAEVRFTRDHDGKINGFSYKLLQGFEAKRLTE